MATIGDQLLAPETGWQRFDNNNPIIKYIGAGWEFVSNTHVNYVAADSIRFNFTGSKIRVIGAYGVTWEATNVAIYIDGTRYVYDQSVGGSLLSKIFFEKLDLPNTEHTVIITGTASVIVGSKNFNLTAIDISDTGSLYDYWHIKTKISVSEMVTGDRISCEYVATANSVGTFSNLGKATKVEIPVGSSETPKGTFYFIMTGYDSRGRRKLVADRVVQNYISWDTLNTAGIASGSGLPLDIREDPVYWDPSRSVVANPPLSDNNLTVGKLSSYTNFIRTTGLGKTRGKYYYELTNLVYHNTGSDDGQFGVVDITLPITAQPPYWYYLGGHGLVDADTTIGLAMDLDNSKLYKVDSKGTMTLLTALTPNKTYLPFISSTGSIIKIRANFGVSSFKYSIPEGYSAYDTSSAIIEAKSATVRLLSGGVSAADKDNEWDKIVVESTLGGSIVAGDNNVWNWLLPGTYNICSTTCSTTSATQRAFRGYSTGVSTYSPGSTATADLSRGFRPVLLVEDTSKVTINKVTPLHLYGTQHVGLQIEASASYINVAKDFKIRVNGVDIDSYGPSTTRNISMDKFIVGNNTVSAVAADGGAASITVIMEAPYRLIVNRTFNSYEGGYITDNVVLDGSAKILSPTTTTMTKLSNNVFALVIPQNTSKIEVTL
jgi:hypothetical protein